MKKGIDGRPGIGETGTVFYERKSRAQLQEQRIPTFGDRMVDSPVPSMDDLEHGDSSQFP